MKMNQRRWLGSAIVVAALVWVIYHFTRHSGWREFNWERLWWLTTHANPGWLLAAVVANYLSYLVRAHRWRYFLLPIKRASLWNLFAAQVLGFSTIYLIGRPGEVVRPAYIARKEQVPFTSQAAIWVLERVYDMVAMVILFGIALYVEPTLTGGSHTDLALRRMHQGAAAILALSALTVAALFIFRLYSERIMGHGSRALGFLPARVRSGLGRLARSFAEGLGAIRDWRDLVASTVCTAVLWFVNTSIFWLVFRALDGTVAELSWWAAALTIFFAAVGLVAQLPGVGGGYQVGVILALQQIFHVHPEAATSAGILIWIVILVPCLALGLVMLVYEGLSFRKLETLAAEEQRAAVPEARG